MITTIRDWINLHPKLKQWLWFVVLWTAGLLTVVALSYPIKWLIKGI